jgi:hypothetical protein
MNTTKTISINGNMFALPEGMTSKDVQSLAGFLCTLCTVRNDYNYDSSTYMYSLGEGVQVQVADRDMLSKEEAQTIESESRARYKAKREAEQES